MLVLQRGASNGQAAGTVLVADQLRCMTTSEELLDGWVLSCANNVQISFMSQD